MIDWDWLWVVGELGFGLLFHHFWKKTDAYIAVLEASPNINIDDLKNFSSTTKRIDFATVRGNVKPLDSKPGSILQSQFLPNCIGVIHQFTIKERRIERERETWKEKERFVSNNTRFVAFRLAGLAGNHILIDKPAQFDKILDTLDVVHVKFEPDASYAAAKIVGVIAGNMPMGIETKERMLLPDVALTGVGRLEREGRQWVLVPHERWGGILTRSTRTEIIDGSRSDTQVLSFFRNIFFVVAGATATYLLYRYWKNHSSNRPPVQRPNTRTATRTVQPVQTVQQNDNTDGSSRLRCIICIDSEVTFNIQPCSHLGLCEECVGRMRNQPIAEQTCPICRAPIQTYQRVFLP